MEEKLVKALRELKKITPDKEYSEKSRNLILSHIPQRVKMGFFEAFLNFQTKKWTMALESVSIILITIIAGTYYFSFLKNDSQNQKLVAQANEINSSIQLKINEIQYLLRMQPTSTSQSLTTYQKLGQAFNLLSSAQDHLKDGKTENSIQSIKASELILKEIEENIRAELDPEQIKPESSSSTLYLDSASTTLSIES